MTRDLRDTTRTEAVDPASWTAPLTSPFQDGPGARGVGAVSIRVDMDRATRLVLGATAMAARHAPGTASRAAVYDAMRGVGRTDLRVAVRSASARGRS